MNVSAMKRALVLPLALVAAALPLTASAQTYRDDYRYNDQRYDHRDPVTVRCESFDHRSRICGIDTRGGVRIVRQDSDAPCVLGQTWGYDQRGIWVSRGCRGRFEVGAGYAYNNGRDNWRYDDNYNDRYGYGYGNNGNGVGYGYGNTYRAGTQAQVIRCESIDGRPRFCGVPHGVSRVTIRRQLSDTRCSQGYNWGYRGDGVWVERGCRAEFVVY